MPEPRLATAVQPGGLSLLLLWLPTHEALPPDELPGWSQGPLPFPTMLLSMLGVTGERVVGMKHCGDAFFWARRAASSKARAGMEGCVEKAPPRVEICCFSIARSAPLSSSLVGKAAAGRTAQLLEGNPWVMPSVLAVAST